MPPSLTRLLLALFFASGFAGLVYEVLWIKFLSLTFGSNMAAVGVVVTTFLVGLAAGAVVFGRLADHHRFPLRLFALLELSIGVTALLFPLALRGVEGLYVALHQQLPGSPLISAAVQFALCALLLLPPTLCMGGTLPVLSTFFRRRELPAGIAALYACNVVGAAAGAFVSGYFLIPALGLSGTGYLVCALNLGIALLAWLKGGQAAEAWTEEPRADGELPRGSALVLACTLLLGFGALASQLLWTRVLVLFLGCTAYAFSGILAMNLLGMALGSAVFMRLQQRIKDIVALFFLLPVLSALYLLLTVPFYDRIPYLVLLIDQSAGTSWFWYSFQALLLVAGMVVIPTFLSGALFPAAVSLYAGGEGGRGRAVGRVLFFNTLGCATGTLAGAFFLVPNFGLQQSFKGVALVLLLASAVATWIGRNRSWTFPKWFVVTLVAGVMGLMLYPFSWDQKRMNSGIYYYATSYASSSELDARLSQGDLVAVYEGQEATVSVWKREDVQYFTINGKVDGGIGDMTTQVLLGQLPVLLHRDPQEVLVIGLGTGVTTATTQLYPARQVETIEISPEVVQAARHFSYVNVEQAATRQRLHIRDARNFLLLDERTYDVIISEPSNPWQTGNANLFTVDFFRLVAERLKVEGVFCQWVPIYDMDTESIRILFQSFFQTFPHAMFFINESDLFMLGTFTEQRFDYQRVNARLSSYFWNSELNYLTSTEDMLAKYFLFSTEIGKAFAGDAPLNTDDRPRIEYSPRYNLSRQRFGGNGLRTYNALFELLDQHSQALPVTNLGNNDLEKKQAIARILGQFSAQRKDYRRPRDVY